MNQRQLPLQTQNWPPPYRTYDWKPQVPTYGRRQPQPTRDCSHHSQNSAVNHRATNKINSHHKQRHQAHTDKHHTVHVPDRHVTSRHHTREATNEEENIPLTDSLHMTNAINQNDLKGRTEGTEQPSIPNKRGSFPTSGETMHNHPGIVADSERR